MSWVQGVVAYVIIWWLVIFAVLPVGVQPTEKGEEGYAAGAPRNPRLGLKALVTTAISAGIWLAVYFLIRSDMISFRTP